ncbi:hypothetical protein VNI00_012442 [Paramarasmius palmivorus]|uniref:Uncharacterized protein n=1 Tax=Paramarasmius palmivorus TaxID=297713 RepID=A0AAW0C4S4_9AGAR
MVILKIDPVESVAHLNNPELTTACQHLETKKYIAYAKETTLDEGARVMMLLERFDTASYESAEMMGDNGHVDGSFIESSLSGIPHPENYQPSHHSYERGSHTPVNEDITLQGARSLLTLSFHGANLASQETPVLKVSFDISQVDQVNDPADYFKEISNLEKLKSEFEEKRKQREIERARQTDEAFIAKFSGETSR